VSDLRHFRRVAGRPTAARAAPHPLHSRVFTAVFVNVRAAAGHGIRLALCRASRPKVCATRERNLMSQ